MLENIDVRESSIELHNTEVHHLVNSYLDAILIQIQGEIHGSGNFVWYAPFLQIIIQNNGAGLR